MPSGIDTVIGKPIGLENLCGPLFCTPGDTKIVKGPTNIADPGPTTQPGPTTDPGPTDNPRTSRFRYSPNRAEVCSTSKTVRWEWSANGRAPWTLLTMVYGLKDCSASDDPSPEPPEQPESPQPDNPPTGNDPDPEDDTPTGNDPDPEDDTPTGNDPDPEDDTPTGNDPDPEEDTTSVTCHDLPDASTICEGQSPSVTCSDGTKRTVAGTKTTGTCICKDAWWTPAPYTCRKPNMLIQESNCDRERRVACTGMCLPNREGYRPLPSEYYTDETFTQSNGCDERPATGTKHRPFSCPDLPNANTICHGKTETVTCSDGRTTRTVHGTNTDCECTDTCPCDETYFAPDGSTPEAYALTVPSHQTFKVTNECGDIDYVWGDPPAQSLAWVTGRTYWRRADTPRHTRKPAWVENGPLVDITYVPFDEPCDRNGKRVVTLSAAAFSAEFHVSQDLYTEHICK